MSVMGGSGAICGADYSWLKGTKFSNRPHIWPEFNQLEHDTTDVFTIHTWHFTCLVTVRQFFPSLPLVCRHIRDGGSNAEEMVGGVICVAPEWASFI